MSRTALIVEDEPDANDILAEIVSRRGFQVIQTYSGEGGLAQARARRPDLMLLDLMLPDIDGFEVCRQLRSSRATNLIPTVMITALAAPHHQVRGFRVGANCYVVKPYTNAQVHQAIDEALAWREQLSHGHVEGELSFDVASESKYVLEVNDLVTSLFLLSPLGERAVNELAQAVWEIGQAAFDWAERKKVDRTVGITYRLHPDRVTVTIRDQGSRRVTPDDAMRHDDDVISYLTIRELLGKREGNAVGLVARGLVDTLEFDDTGSEARLTKRYGTAAGAAVQAG